MANLISSFDPRAIRDYILNFDPVTELDRLRNTPIQDVRWSAVTLFIILFGIITIVLYANFFSEDSAPPTIEDKLALGSHSKPTQAKKDAPPIPPSTKVVALRVYPIKSCRGIAIDSTTLTKRGLLLDRNWMFIAKSDRKFLTIRSDPSMTLIDTSVNTSDPKQPMLEISIHGTESRASIPAFPSKEWLDANTTLSNVEIWEKETDAYEYGPEINKAFCDFFGKDVALVYKGPRARNIATNGAPELYGRAQEHNFADVISLQVASEASMKDLNRRLKSVQGADELTIERFRPNIIVRGRDEKPWEEDTWKRIRITTSLNEEELLYKLDLDVVARCARCQVPNVNPDTAEKHAKQPWDELMKFRRVDKGGVAKWKPCFGMLCVPKNEGVVKVGATLEVIETTGRHLYNTAKFEDL